MDEKGYDLWLEKFDREIGIKSSVILYGNTGDLTCGKLSGNVYQSLIKTIVPYLERKGYKSIIKWDRVDGIDWKISTNIANLDKDNKPPENAYDLGSEFIDEENSPSTLQYKNPEEFFPYMAGIMRNRAARCAVILDYSDYIFGNANALSERELNYIAMLGKSIQDAQDNRLNEEDVHAVGNIIVLITRNVAKIPPSYYLNNPLVSSINVPLPGRNERERFVKTNLSCLSLRQNLDSNRADFDDFIDSLDGFSLRDIAQIIKLSRQISDSQMTFEKLINLYKFGAKISPWEELSSEKLEGIEEKLKERVKGQDYAISKVKDVVIRAYTGFAGLQHSSKHSKPKGTLFFVGPTGVGKTELAKALADFIFGDENACIRFDMSEYSSESSDQRLIGALPGYIGYEAGGQLTNAVKAKPFCVLLFDEIEKAHGRILDKFLQILEDGRLTDGKGETVYFSEAIIIFTSNIGAADVQPNTDVKEVRKIFSAEVSRYFIRELGRPELLNRIGNNIVFFNFIEAPEVFVKIAQSKFKHIVDFVQERYKAEIRFENEKDAFLSIAKISDRQNGGRGMLNLIEDRIINPLATFIFQNSKFLAGRQILIRQIKTHFDFDLE